MAFATTYGEVEAGTLKQEAIELLQVKFPGWEPGTGDLFDWLVEADSRIDANVFEQMSSLEQAAFKRFGEAIVSIPPIQASPATVESVWTMIDAAGHEPIPAGTLVNLPDPAGALQGFETVGDTEVPIGVEKVTILLEAVEPGTAGNGLTGEPDLQTSLSYVLVPGGIELSGATAGGVDEEEEGAYLNRLVEAIRLLSIALIVPENFEVDARSHAGIYRAKCVRGWNPEAGTTGNPLMQGVAPIGEDGLPVSELIKAELLASQQERLLEGVIHHVADPTYTTVDVKASVVVEAGFDPSSIKAAVEARLAQYLSPATWGLPSSGEGSGWINRTTVYRNELISIIDRVGGVDRVENVELARHGSGLGTANVVLTGVVPLVKPGTLEVTAA